MLLMVIETFRDNDMVPVYQRFKQSGRGLPHGLEFVESWVEANLHRCFQVMKCEDAALLQEWVAHWRGTGVTMEIVPVVPSATTRKIVEPYLE